jgi:alcohol dehydrogenase class IV
VLSPCFDNDPCLLQAVEDLAVERALGAGPAAAALQNLAMRIGAPASLAAIGMPKDGIDKAADLAVADPYLNPRPIDRASIAALITKAFAGKAIV